MNTKKLFGRISALTAGLALPASALAITGVATASGNPTAGGAYVHTAIVTLLATVEGVLDFKVEARSGAAPNLTLATSDSSDTVDFGTINANSDGSLAPAEGVAVDVDNGAIFLARLQSSLFYTGYNQAVVEIDQKVAPLYTGAGTATHGAEYEFRSLCEPTITAGDNTAWANGAPLAWNPTAATDVLDATAHECFSGSQSNAGITINEDVDLAMHIANTAPAGVYRGEFRFTVTAESI